jgi:hypothetical protein
VGGTSIQAGLLDQSTPVLLELHGRISSSSLDMGWVRERQLVQVPVEVGELPRSSLGQGRSSFRFAWRDVETTAAAARPAFELGLPDLFVHGERCETAPAGG